MNSPVTGPHRDLFLIALCAVAAVLVAVDFLIPPSRFYDYDSYLFYIDSIWYFPTATPLYMEPLSRAYLYIARGISSTSDLAVDLSHYLLGAAYLVGMYALLHSRRDGWQALIVAFAITGPLLALVTIRATPAYLLVALAVITAADRPLRSIAFMVLAICFHISTGLVVIPWAFLLLRNKLPTALRAERLTPLLILGGVTAVLFLYFGQAIISTLLSLVEGFPVLNKYIVYSQEYGPQTGQERVTSISHYIFFIFTLGYAVLFLAFGDEDAKKINLYVVASLAIYVTLFFGLSPVAALRQACFWQLPMTVMMPWRRLGMTPAVAPFAMAGALAFFLFQLSQVYQ
jgi:EpsG family